MKSGQKIWAGPPPSCGQHPKEQLLFREIFPKCRFKPFKAAPVEEATKLVAKRNAVAVVGAGEVGLPWQLVQGGGGQDQVGHGSHQQHQGHPHGQRLKLQRLSLC